ncbi:MAG: hypothetical protein FJ265_07025 [Planctomycetes bacterium]|nr:hypothetical protein [Planctomycetota bacterium]
MKPAPAVCLVFVLAASLAAQGYATGFEAPTFNASAAGTIITGQDGFYLPVAGSTDGLVFTYAGNTLNVPANPNGGANFYAGAAAGGTAYARAQRATTYPANNLVYVQFDVLCKYTGTVVQTNNIGSFSFQPSTTNVYVNLLARWPTPLTFPPATWNADYVLGPTLTGTQSVLPDPAFQNLAVDVWHTWGCTADLTTGTYLDFRIRNGVTNTWTVYTPPTPLALPGQGAPLPAEFRFFGGGTVVGNVFAVDNFIITGALYTQYGTGCPGALGVPALGPAPASMPLAGATFSAELRNLPLGLGIIATGFSNTLAYGSIPLPMSLAPYGFPGCDLLADPLTTTFLIGAGNTATWPFAIPVTPNFVGLTLYQQGISIDTGPAGAAFGNGARLIVGS